MNINEAAEIMFGIKVDGNKKYADACARIIHIMRAEAAALTAHNLEGAKDLKEAADLFADTYADWEICDECRKYVPSVKPGFHEMKFCSDCWDGECGSEDVDVRQLEVAGYNKKGGVL